VGEVEDTHAVERPPDVFHSRIVKEHGDASHRPTPQIRAEMSVGSDTRMSLTPDISKG